MRLLILLLISINCFGQRLYVGPSFEFIYDQFEYGVSIGNVFKDRWTGTLEYNYAKNYNYLGLHSAWLFSPISEGKTNVGFGLKMGLYDGRYIGLRPYMENWFRIGKRQNIKADVTLRRMVPDITISYLLFLKPIDNGQ